MSIKTVFNRMSKKDAPVVSIKAFSVDNLEVSTAQRSEHKLKDLIFLPFNKYWQTFLVCTIVGNFILVSYSLVFLQDELSSSILLLFYFFEVMYLINTIAVIAHRFNDNNLDITRR